MRTIKLACLVTALGPAVGAGPAARSALRERDQSPRRVKVPQPHAHLGSGPQRGAARAYQILVASSEEKLKANEPDLWDSGLVRSEKRMARYAGKPLVSIQRCYWKLRVWENYFQNGSWTEPAMWEMGVLHFGEPKAGGR